MTKTDAPETWRTSKRRGFEGRRRRGRRTSSVVSRRAGPSQIEMMRAVGPNSLMTWRQAPQGEAGLAVGV